jgi:hypothetical protein
MNSDKIKKNIEVASNVAVFLVATALLVGFVRNYLFAAPPVTLRPGFQKGARLPDLQVLDFNKSRKTVLIALDSRCSSCRDNLSSIQALAANVRGSSGSPRVVAVFPTNEEGDRRYAEGSNLSAELIFGLDLGRLGLTVLPAVILVDDSGTVLDFWLGAISKETEVQLIRSLS